MTVLYDHQCFTGATYGGVSRYFFDLMRHYVNRSDIQFELSLLLSNNEYLRQQSFSRHWRYRPLAHQRNVNRAASLLNRQFSLRRIKAGHYDVFHPTYYHRYFLNALGRKPFVLTFHDASSERFGDKYPELGAGLYETKKILLARADAVIAVSQFTKDEILRFFSVDPAKIHVVPLSTSMGELTTSAALAHQPKLPYPYLLFVGKRDLYKNFTGFFRALTPVMAQHPDLRLVCAGGGSFSAAEQALFRNAQLTDRVVYAPIASDLTLLHLYQHAQAFVFPSLNEGFGIPVLEAFAGQCPAILSERSSLPEVAGPAAVYFDPEREESITDAIGRVVGNDTLRAELVRLGTERLTHFSGQKTAEQTLAVYQSLR
ncbi:glycosyltransferase family 4 protein [Spirosoma luteolum]